MTLCMVATPHSTSDISPRSTAARRLVQRSCSSSVRRLSASTHPLPSPAAPPAPRRPRPRTPESPTTRNSCPAGWRRRNVERIACSQGGCQSWRNSSTQVTSSTPTAMRVASSRRGTTRNAASMKNTTYGTLAGPQLSDPPVPRTGVELGCEAEGGHAIIGRSVRGADCLTPGDRISATVAYFHRLHSLC